jgi:ankyrin repeat protein
MMDSRSKTSKRTTQALPIIPNQAIMAEKVPLIEKIVGPPRLPQRVLDDMLSLACGAGNIASAIKAISEGADVNGIDEKGLPILRVAVIRGQTRAAELLLANGARAGYNLFFADTKEIGRLLISYGADVNARCEDNSTALMRAANCGKREVVELLLAHKADINVKDVLGRTALDHARTGRYWSEYGGGECKGHDETIEILALAQNR